MRVIVWYSDGAASAVAAYYVLNFPRAYARNDVLVVKCDTTNDEHQDNVRFRQQVEGWIKHPITLISSEKYSGIDDVFTQTRYMAGISGARCTTELKKLPRMKFQRPGDLHVFGYTADEQKRIKTFEENNPELSCYWPLLEWNITKEQCYNILKNVGIPLPKMYTLGFDHNNCLGCVKATSPKYWARVRQYFPEVFARRATQSRALGVRLARYKGKRIFLDELPNIQAGKGGDGEIECGPFCEIPVDGTMPTPEEIAAMQEVEQLLSNPARQEP